MINSNRLLYGAREARLALAVEFRESLWRDRAIIDFRHAYLLKSESKTLAHFSAYRKEKILFLFSEPRP
jgi:hypothetical protein